MAEGLDVAEANRRHGELEQRLRDSLASAEAERRRWSRELRDETLQALGGLRVVLWSARVRDELHSYRAGLDRAIEQLDIDIADLRALITELRPAALDQLGLQPAIAILLDRHRSTGGLEIRADVVLPRAVVGRPTLSPELDTTVYRLVQEALANVARHAEASFAYVGVRAGAREVVVHITDDGAGFDVQAPREGFGLSGLRDRVLVAGGTFTVESHERRGTRLRAVLPRTLAAVGADARAAASAPVASADLGRSPSA